MKFPTIKLPQKTTRAIGKLAYKTVKAKPGICIVVGIVLGGAAIVLTGIDTYKNKERLVEDTDKIKKLKAPVDENSEAETLISEEEKKILLTSARKQLMFDFARTYWKELALSTGAVFFILHGKKLYKHQIAELGAMYGALMESYRRYRQNVINDIGAEKDQEYMYGLTKVEAVDSETGEVSESYIVNGDTELPSTYARYLNEGIFDHATGQWIWQNTLYDENRITMQKNLKWLQDDFNDILIRKGYLTLNEVYDKLGFPQTAEGQHVGWVSGGFVDGKPCDNFVDFGVFPPDELHPYYHQLPINKAFMDLRTNQKYPLLDFNVVCIDSIWNDIFEYNNKSFLAYDKRRAKNEGLKGSTEALNRWFLNNDILESEGH